MSKYDGWVIKTKWGSRLLWSFGRTKRKVRQKVTFWEAWEKTGAKIVKVKIVEVDDEQERWRNRKYYMG